MTPKPRLDSATSDSAVITKATIRAADRLNVKNKTLARIIGVSESTVTRMKQGDYPLEPGEKPFELAVLFVRLYRSLDTVIGGDDSVASEWLTNENTAMKGKPIEIIQTVSGLTNVIQYLDSRRAIV
jgi:uncharacterized protein (DUF2384 family)